ncbi:acetylglutamate kinase [Bacillaceae bacterium SIJ1]|uniref:acetylglutamate kinase n=1 Tax=Litoribacterium kuwaitense TaxID=1398745 RepID=UPI0013EADA16|nr:acetylglutamate kinase [Litoribacterium kuwaitense]NGP44550.1 acetylglutamate kinase [Litoribacterium kuwaitense]
MTRPIVVIKCGGSTLDNLSDCFFQGVKQLQMDGKQPVIVHGGGPDIESVLEKMAIKTEFHEGLRKTTASVMEVVEMVLAGRVNKRLVTKLRTCGIDASGLAGCDGGMLQCQAINRELLGYVGDVKHVQTNVLEGLIDDCIVPVIAPLGVDSEGIHYNINADTAASAIANALQAEQMMFVTDVPGIMKDGQVIQELTETDVEQLMTDGTIYGGMIPKVKAALATLKGSLKEVAIVQGAQNHSQNGICGTTITRSLEVVR